MHLVQSSANGCIDRSTAVATRRKLDDYIDEEENIEENDASKRARIHR